METKLIKIAILLLLGYSGFAQSDLFFMKNVYLNDIQMSGPFGYYTNKMNCFVRNEIEDEYDDESIYHTKTVIYECDSIEIQVKEGITKKPKYSQYTHFIKVYSSKYNVSLDKMKFRVGMSVDEIGLLLPPVKKEYDYYIKNDSANFHRADFYGIPLSIENANNEEVPVYFCQGLKFQLLEGKVISILIDFRSDGDFD